MYRCLALFAILPFVTQRPDVLPPRVFALRDAKVVTEAGHVLPRATLVIRDGQIEAVGPEVKAPADALLIDGKGLTVYPGFIDGLGHWGIDVTLRRPEGGPPASPDIASDALIATPLDHRKGITPEFQARTALKADEELETAWRKAGFTARVVAPESGILIGQGAIVSLSGSAPRDALLLSPSGLHVSLRTMGGNEYPRALMGVVAFARQTFLDAEHYRHQWDVYRKNGGKGKRPPVDPSLAALEPYLDGKLPVLFEADSRDEISRALDFAAEFKLKPIIYSGRDAWKVADRLAQTKSPVLLRLAFTEAPKREDGITLPPRVEADREKHRKEEHRCASLLQQKGVPFAFSMAGLAADKVRANLRLAIEAGLKPDDALQALTSRAADIHGVKNQIGSIAPGKAAHLVVMDGDFHEAETQVKYVFADGMKFEYEVKKKASKPVEKPKDTEKAAKPVETIASEIDEDRLKKSSTGGNVLIRGATLVTITTGIQPETDLLVRGGKIAALGKNLPVASDVRVIDAKGMFVMPGIIDTHSHFAIAGGVNEFSLSVVPEVRVRDVIQSEDVQIYRGLAGGVTTARLLHGSANVIGGQDAVIKLKYGEPTEKLLLADAPKGVKFALGENVKRTDGRFPNTRLGVEAVLVRAFTEAKAYRETWKEYEQAKDKPNVLIPRPRRDLRLEALSQILAGEIKVHCHCYRSDEILMLLRVADRFGIKIKSLQHVLEGYKIAPEIADHGASCSIFSDWWAYKIEANDAIPYAAALLHKAGAEVCFKSDSNELMRHLYQEAAKAIKYGGMSEEDAFKTITLNPAKQLGLDKRLGSLEVGKDADLALFNGHPLNSLARVEMVLIEGEPYFQRSEKLTPFEAAKAAPEKPAKDFKTIALSPSGSYLLVGATLHNPGAQPRKATVYVKKGRIAQVVVSDQKDVSVDPGTKMIDCVGLHLFPGMIDAGTVLGLTELGSAKETHDYADSGDFQPDLRASVGINPDSDLIPVTRANGVTTVVTRPTGSIIAGQSAVINLAGWVPSEMALVDPLALHIDFPSPSTRSTFLTDPNGPNPGKSFARKQRDEKVKKLKELFEQAKAYAGSRNEKQEKPGNPRLEALVPYARGEKPVIVQAHREEEIRKAFELADELKIKMILTGAIDAWKVASELKKRDIAVILGPIMALPNESHDPYDAAFTCAAKLHQAGVRFCIRTGGGSNTRNLPYEAAMAASYGLPVEEAFKSVTLYPARILGLEKDLGSIENGKRANLVLTNGDILQASTQVLGLFIDGKPMPPTSKHTRLYDRYLERLDDVKNGRAPLGTK